MVRFKKKCLLRFKMHIHYVFWCGLTQFVIPSAMEFCPPCVSLSPCSSKSCPHEHNRIGLLLFLVSWRWVPHLGHSSLLCDVFCREAGQMRRMLKFTHNGAIGGIVYSQLGQSPPSTTSIISYESTRRIDGIRHVCRHTWLWAGLWQKWSAIQFIYHSMQYLY